MTKLNTIQNNENYKMWITVMSIEQGVKTQFVSIHLNKSESTGET
jgi:hypothetical protein